MRAPEGPAKYSTVPPRKIVTTASVVVVLLLLVLASFAVFFYVTPLSGGKSSPTPTTAYINLTISYDAQTGQSSFSLSTISVPPNTRVVFTIVNHDPVTSPLIVPWDQQVIGTVTGNEAIRMGNGTSDKVVTALAPWAISHTFTVLDSQYNLSVPIPPASDVRTPATVTFAAQFNTKGTFAWGCMCRCEDMTILGVMYGTLEVT